MSSSFSPFVELLNGTAYCPHPGDAALPLGRRFPGKVIVIVGGGGTGMGWTQRVRFDFQGSPHVDGVRSPLFKRGSAEWVQHLSGEARRSSGWCVILIEQQWQAAVASVSSASVGLGGVEQMLRVRESVSLFGDDRMSEDAIRAAVDHPTMEGSIVAGVRSVVLEPLQAEVMASQFQIAAMRIAVFGLLERYLAKLQRQRVSPTRTLVAYDGLSALMVTVRDGAFELSEGALSYLVNRGPADVRSQVIRRLAQNHHAREGGSQVEVIGTPLGLEGDAPPEAAVVQGETADSVLVAVDEYVRHDLRTDLQEMRLALPRWTRPVLAAAALFVLGCLSGGALHLYRGHGLSKRIEQKTAERALHLAAIGQGRSRIAEMRGEELRARQISTWVEKNYHAQALVHAFFLALPAEVSLDAVSLQAAEGLPQARLKFTLLGSEDAQRSALRALEAKLYQLGYDVGRREDPSLSSQRRGGVAHAWDLILPSFGT